MSKDLPPIDPVRRSKTIEQLLVEHPDSPGVKLLAARERAAPLADARGISDGGDSERQSPSNSTTTFGQGPIDYQIEGSRAWSDLTVSEQDQYLLGCFLGEDVRAQLEKRLKLFDRTASSIAGALMGPFRQYDMQTGIACYAPESAARADRVKRIRMVALQGTPLGRRLNAAHQRASKQSHENPASDVQLRFYSVGAAWNRGLWILDDREFGGMAGALRYDGNPNDWTAIEAHQAAEISRAREIETRRGSLLVPEKGIDDAPETISKPQPPTSETPNQLSAKFAATVVTEGEAPTKPYRISRFQKAVWMFFPSKESQLIKRAVQRALKDDPISMHSIHRDLNRLLKQHHVLIRHIRDEGVRPEKLGLLAARKILHNHLCSGEHHVHRGALSQLGEHLLRSFTSLNSRLVEEGFESVEEAEEANRSIIQEIKLAG